MIIIEELVEKTKQGDKEAYSELISSLQTYLYKVAITRTKNEDDAQEVIQIAFIKAYLRISKLKKNNLFKTWITKILINECNNIYRNRKKANDFLEKYITNNKLEYSLDDGIDFENIIKCLNEKEKNIFKLYYEDGLNIRQISVKLHMNENTIKSILKRGRGKIKNKYKPATILVFILCLLITTSVIAISIISYVKSLFELNSVGIENSGVVAAIEHKEWFQETNMDYIDLGDGYKIKADYILMDEMNLYMTFDFVSEKDISKFNDISIPDLKIIDENGNIICNEENIFDTHYSKKTSSKSIKNNKHNISVLVYMYTDSFPISKTLDINFSKIILSSKSMIGKNKYDTIISNCNFKIELSDKFINRQSTIYKSNKDEIEKAIITETGFYSIINIDNNKLVNNITLVDEDGISYNCYRDQLNNYDTSSNTKYIVISNFNNSQSKKLQLIIDNEKYNLIQKQ